MKRSLSGFFLLVLLAPAFATLQELTINADTVNVEKARHLIEAAGSVEAVYKDIVLNAAHVVYNTSAESFYADQGFRLYYNGITFEGQTLDYRLVSREGTATDTFFHYQKVELGGRRLKLDADQIEINGANFTTCDLEEPHYRVTASDILLYPRYGWLVAYWGYFWLGRVPVVPMPTYIYDFNAADRAQKNLPPFPAVGSDPDDGTYISETLAWHLRRELSGTYTLSYAANKGLGGGAQANYIVNDHNTGNVRLYGNVKDRLFGGLTHYYVFGGEVGGQKAGLIDLFPLPHYRQFELETDLSFRERLNYQRVSFTPGFALRSRRGEVWQKEAKYDLELKSALVAEEGNTRLTAGGYNLRFYGDFQEFPVGYVTPSLVLDSTYYGNGTRWVKPQLALDIAKRFSRDFSLSGTYSHYLTVDGTSPFLYELYRFRGVDRLQSTVTFKSGETGGKLHASYFLDNWSPEDIDYSFLFRLHCYDLEATYRSMRGEFLLSFSLAAQ
ncbi:MAG: hypothetical protein WC529_07430 [Candidatus Margulisiibacteriota bacterium]